MQIWAELYYLQDHYVPRKKRKRHLARYPPLLLSSAPMLYHFANCEIDARLYQLRRDGTQVSIEPRVFDVLVYLLTHRDRVVSKDELFDKLWPGQVVTETALTRCIVAARKAVGDDGTKQEIIETQHGRGYRFVAAVTEYDGAFTTSPSSDGISSVSVTENGQSHEVVLGPVLLPVEYETNEHAVNAISLPGEENQKAEQVVSHQFSVVSRVGIAHHSWLAGILTLLIATLGVVRYWPFSIPNTQHPAPNTQSLPLPDKPSIIVLPFTNRSGDPSQEYFSDGLTDGIITELSRIPELFVIARQSAFSYKHKAMAVQDIGREMGVRYVLEGSVQKVTRRLRIFAQLSDATTGEQLWAERYDLELSDTMTVQEQIRQKIAALHNLGIEQMKN